MEVKRNPMDLCLKSTCEGWTGKKLYPDLIPEDGDEALVMVSDEISGETKLYTRRVHYDENSITLEGRGADMVFAGDERKNVIIVGRVEEPGHIVLSRQEYSKKAKPVSAESVIADAEQIDELKAALERLLELDPSQDDFVLGIKIKTHDFTTITKNQCAALNRGMKEMLAAYGSEERT